MIKVCKRNGNTVDFDENKIFTAISSAYAEVHGDIAEKEDEIGYIVDNVVETINRFSDTIHVETIQDIIEREIAEYDFSVSKAYITYRYQRKLARNDYDVLMDAVAEKLGATNIENQNANVDEKSFGGRIGSMASLVAKHYALNYIMSELAKSNHENNMIYTHDLDHYAIGDHNCLSVPIDDLLENGFNTRQTDVRPAKSVNTAFQLLAVLFQVQSLQQFGGVSATHLDWSMVKYVRLSLFKHYLMEYIKDCEGFDSLNLLDMSEDELDEWVEQHKSEYLEKMCLTKDDFYIDSPNLDKRYYQRALFETIKECYQAVEGMYHNLNTLQSRSGNQLPFSSINYGTCTLPEGRLIIKALLEVSIKGIGKLHRTSIFPCGIFQCMKGVNLDKDDANYDLFQLAIKSTATRLYPNYANCDWSGNAGYDKNNPKTYFSTMG